MRATVMRDAAAEKSRGTAEAIFDAKSREVCPPPGAAREFAPALR